MRCLTEDSVIWASTAIYCWALEYFTKYLSTHTFSIVEWVFVSHSTQRMQCKFPFEREHLRLHITIIPWEMEQDEQDGGRFSRSSPSSLSLQLAIALFMCCWFIYFFAEHSENTMHTWKKLINNVDRLIKQIHNIFWKNILAVTFVYPSLHNRVKTQTKPSTRLYQN